MLRTIIVDHNPLFGDAGIAALAGGLPRTFGRGAGFPGEAATMVLFFVNGIPQLGTYKFCSLRSKEGFS